MRCQVTTPDARCGFRGAFLKCYSSGVHSAGKLIYNLYGSKTEEAFVKSWGIGLAIENATQFQDIVNEAGKAFLILLVLDLVITGPARWVRS